MTTAGLLVDWQKYGVDIQGTIKPLKEAFMLCCPYTPIPGTILFDTGGPQGAPAYVLKVGENGEDLISVNPNNPAETNVLGKLVLL